VTPRPYWKGHLKLALVSCPIALHAACSTSERIAFRQINRATGNRLRQQLVDEETREPVAPEHKSRGYEFAKGQYLVVEEEELDAIEIVPATLFHRGSPRGTARQGWKALLQTRPLRGRRFFRPAPGSH
jgi:non-homologous end joining protein Ku